MLSLGEEGLLFLSPFFLSLSLSLLFRGIRLFVHYDIFFVCFALRIFFFFPGCNFGTERGTLFTLHRRVWGCPSLCISLVFCLGDRAGGKHCQMRSAVPAVRTHRPPPLLGSRCRPAARAPQNFEVLSEGSPPAPLRPSPSHLHLPRPPKLSLSGEGGWGGVVVIPAGQWGP